MNLNKNKEFLYLTRNLWIHLNLKRKKQLFLLFITILLSATAEVISLGSFIPFLAALINRDELNNIRSFKFLIGFLGISSDESILLFLTLIFAFAAILATLTRLINLWVTERVVAGIGSDFSCDAFRKSLCQPYSVHLNKNSSELIKVITLQVDTTIKVINAFLRMVTSLFIFTFVFVFLVITDWQIAFLSIFSFSAIYGLIIKFSKRILLKNSEKIDFARFNQIKSIQEGLGSIRDVIINGKHHRYLKSYKAIDIPLRSWMAQNNLISASPRFVIEGISLVLISFLSFVLIQERGDSGNVIPIIGTIALAAQRMIPALQIIFKSWSSIKSNNAAIRAVFSVLDQEDFYQNIREYVNPLVFKKHIEFKNVFFKYRNSSSYVLKNIDLKINKGEVIGIIGETGSGKSSFIDLLMGLLQPTSGEILIDGKLIRNNQNLLHRWYATISHVPQDLYLNNTTIAENIAFGIKKNEIDYDHLKKVAEKAQILDFVLSLPYRFDTIIGERGINLSGGQRQRLSIARSLYKDASVIIFDEATSALDNKTENLIMQSLNDSTKEFTFIMVAHRLTSLKNCTKILKFNKGKLEKVLNSYQLDQD